MNNINSISSVRKETSRSIQARQTKTRIVKGYMDMGKELGFSKITVTGLCSRLGISVGNFYHHFKSLEDLGHQIYFSLDELIDTLITRSGEEFKNMDPRDRLITFSGWFARHNVEAGLEHTKRIYSGSNTNMTVRKETTTHVELFVKDFWKEYGLQDKYDLDEMVRFIRVTMRGVMLDWAMHDGNYDAEAAMKNAVACVIDGILQTRPGKQLLYEGCANM